MDLDSEIPDLKQFMSCYFTEEWVEEFTHEDDVVSRFVAVEPTEWVMAATQQLERLLPLVEGMNHRQLADLLGCNYYPVTIQWLQRVLVLLRQGVHSSPGTRREV
jgi:hypothetical protein